MRYLDALITNRGIASAYLVVRRSLPGRLAARREGELHRNIPGEAWSAAAGPIGSMADIRRRRSRTAARRRRLADCSEGPWRALTGRRRSAYQDAPDSTRTLRFGPFMTRSRTLTAVAEKPRQNATQANCGAGPNIGAIGSRECIWASAGRGRSGARARSRSSRNGGGSYARREYCRVEWWTGTRHCANSRPSQVAEARTLRASGILQTKASATGSLNRHGLREKHMCDCLKLNLGSFCHFDDRHPGQA